MKYTKFRKKYKDLYEDLKEQMEKDIYNALQTLGYRGEKNHKDMMKFARKNKINIAIDGVRSRWFGSSEKQLEYYIECENLDLIKWLYTPLINKGDKNE